ncbi:MAG TPA: prepilin-type N-terminal cleavage/methylation domain-containing protein [Gemmatimonadales bacterium]
MPDRRGVTLIEMMVAITLLVLVFAAAVPLFQVQARALSRQAGRIEALQTARFVAASLERELRVAGPPNEVEEQPLLVQAHPMALTINADLASRDTGSASAVYFDPDIPASDAQALTVARAVALPHSAISYPAADYRSPAGEGSDAETISYWLTADPGAARADQFALWRRVNDGDSVLVARKLIVRAGRPFFQYLKPELGDTLRPIASSRLPAYHTVAMHGSSADTGAFAVVDEVRAVRIVTEVLYTDPRLGDTTHVSEATIRLLNAGLIRRSTCGTAPLGTTLSVVNNPGGIVTLSWNASIDETGGEQDVERYALFRRPAGAPDWGEPFRSVPARGGPYAVDDTEVKPIGSQWQYSILAQDCTPMNSARAVAPTLTITQ